MSYAPSSGKQTSKQLANFRITMKLLKKLAALAVFAGAATGLFAQDGSSFTIYFDFSTAEPTLIAPPNVFDSVSAFEGGTVSGGTISDDFDLYDPAVFSFDFDVVDGYAATITGFQYAISNTGTNPIITGVTTSFGYDSGDTVLFAGDTYYGAPSLSSGPATDGTISFDTVATEGSVSMDYVFITGVISAVPEVSTVLFSGIAGFFAFMVARRRRSAIKAAA
ncbi:hypothetical protein [Pelagicoccus albus]|uniref:PEP-CTERM protein-sorting domain-containing protein n=1 Tax=Pelagicoccus albus TaxID=415222 RepID=A0A7X1B2H6_9BACT|nr:hypothetical protein [Pelagicoccus albus]MBC2604439.1 hypothetical protein [Pelagicoccus albus]